MPPERLDHSLATHRHVRLDGNILLDNPFYEPPDSAMHRIADALGLPKKLEWLRSALTSILGGVDPEPAPIRARQ